jgi:hypothetical protein
VHSYKLAATLETPEIGVKEGAPLTPQVHACMVASLRTPIELRPRLAGEVFPEYDGQAQMLLRMGGASRAR